MSCTTLGTDNTAAAPPVLLSVAVDPLEVTGVDGEEWERRSSRGMPHT
jgi:hypothetical protein